ncbi:MAG TPA: sigma-70 family RNA polymerase sigma factor [Frankiaceae bacterium]|nr:sigma-70 family RNA polymerase sigma factor [Frankiaceae bacterium]
MEEDVEASGRHAPAGDPAGDVERLVAAVYAEHGPALRAYCLRATGDPQLAEDAVQEVMLRAWRNPHALDPTRGPARAWLFTVARNVVIDAARARRSRPREVGADGPERPDPTDDLERALEAWQVAEALARLSPAHRAVLVQMYYLDRSVAEVALELGVPAGTVKSRAYYALRALKLALQEAGVTA